MSVKLKFSKNLQWNKNMINSLKKKKARERERAMKIC